MQDARLGLTPGLLHKGLALLSDVELLQRLIGDVLTALGIPSSDETPSPELSRDSTPPTIGMGREVTGDEEVTSGEKVAADTPGSSAQRLPGWSILDLARRLTNAALPEDQRVQRVAFKLLTALASSLRFPGAFKDTRSSAGLLVSPAAKPYSVLVTPSWTLPTWSAAVAVFEFKPHASQDELDVMMGQVSNGVARSAAPSCRLQAHAADHTNLHLLLSPVSANRLLRSLFRAAWRRSVTSPTVPLCMPLA